MSQDNDIASIQTTLIDSAGNDVEFYLTVELKKRVGVLVIGSWTNPRVNLDKLHRTKEGVGLAGKTLAQGRLENWGLVSLRGDDGTCTVTITTSQSTIRLASGSDFAFYWFRDVSLPKL